MRRPFLIAGPATVAAAAATAVAVIATPAPAISATTAPFLGGLPTISTLGSTVPANGDVNPYGIATVPTSAGKLKAGRILISNFNDAANNQGTGTTIVQMTPSGGRSLFARITRRSLPGNCPGGVGLTTALSVLPGGYVVVGSLPTTNGMSATARAGCLIVVNDNGRPVSTISGSKLQGPWDMTAKTVGSVTNLFVSTVLNGGARAGRHTVANSTVVRIRIRSSATSAPVVLDERVIANRIPWRNDPAALVIGPTGVALAPDGTLYVADTLDNRIAAVKNALTRTTAAGDAGATLTRGGLLKQPLGLTLAPNGDILTTNAGDGNIVETSPSGHQLKSRTLDSKTGAGSLFGLTLAPGGRSLYFVDDGDNTLRRLH